MSEITLALEHPSLGCGEIIARYDLSKIQEKAYNQGRADERAKTYEEYSEEVLTRFCAYCNQESCEGGMVGSIQECQTISTLRDIVNELECQFI